jgi:filamentous hemagglutinin
LVSLGVANNIRTELSMLQVDAGSSLLDAFSGGGDYSAGEITATLIGGAILARLAGPKLFKLLSKCRNTTRCDWEVPVRINWSKQNRHIVNNQTDLRRSTLTHPDPEYLLTTRSGTGQAVAGEYGKAGYRERVDFGTIIGDYRSNDGSVVSATTKGIIHYGNEGAHIIPARP